MKKETIERMRKNRDYINLVEWVDREELGAPRSLVHDIETDGNPSI